MLMYVSTAGKLATLLEWKPLLDVGSDVVQSVADFLSEENMDIVLEVEDETAAEGAVFRLPEPDGRVVTLHAQFETFVIHIGTTLYSCAIS